MDFIHVSTNKTSDCPHVECVGADAAVWLKHSVQVRLRTR
jgi:hypothetical protein